MAFDAKPSTWLGAGYALDGTNHLISLNTVTASSNKLLKQLTDTKAHATTGDIRDVMMGVCESFFQAWTAQAAADRPAKMTISRSASSTTADKVVFTYTLKFTVDASTFAMAAE